MAICMVCNCEVIDGVICPDCSAQKHHDCHEYFPACARYGCENAQKPAQEGNAEITLVSILGGIGFALYFTDEPKQGLCVLTAMGLGVLCGLLVCYTRKYLGLKVKPSEPVYLLPEDRKQVAGREQKMLEQRLIEL